MHAHLNACAYIFRSYGVPIVNCKPLLKELRKIFSHADKFVRAEVSVRGNIFLMGMMHVDGARRKKWSLKCTDGWARGCFRFWMP